MQLSVDELFICVEVGKANPLPFRKTVIFLQIAFGRTVSLTVTLEEQVVEFPDRSVAVTVTVLTPIFGQVNIVWEATKDWIPQLSVGLFAGGETIVTVPELLRKAVRLKQVNEGGLISKTVTAELQVLEFELLSVTVSVTALLPRLAQVKLDGAAFVLKIPQASFEPLFI